MKIYLEHLAVENRFQIERSAGNTIQLLLDGDEKPNGSAAMELLLASLASCLGSKVVDRLEVQKAKISKFWIELDGFLDLERTPVLFKDIYLKMYLIGHINKNVYHHISKNIIENYCSVCQVLEETTSISYHVFLNQELLFVHHSER